MRRKLFALLAALTFVLPVFAQDTPEPTAPPVVVVETPDDAVEVDPNSPIVIIRDQNPVLLVALAISAVLLAVFGAALLVLARQGFNSLPPWAQELVRNNEGYIDARVDEGFDALDRMALLTPNTLDDLLVKFGREHVEQWIKDFYARSDAESVDRSQPHR